jgi:hypothetical protein
MVKAREALCIVTLFVTHDIKHNIRIHIESTIQYCKTCLCIAETCSDAVQPNNAQWNVTELFDVRLLLFDRKNENSHIYKKHISLRTTDVAFVFTYVRF